MMSTLSRATGKALHKSISSFNVVSDMVKRAVDKNSPSLVKSLARNRAKMDDCFVDLCYCYDCFKSDTISSDGISEEIFNSSVDGQAKYSYNDSWLEKKKMSYYDLVQASDEKLETISEVTCNVEQKTDVIKQDSRQLSSLEGQIEMLSGSITSTISKVSTEVSRLIDGGENPAKISSLQFTLQKVDDKIDGSYNVLVNQVIALTAESEVHEKEALRKQFILQEKSRIDNLYILLASKVKDTSPTAVSISSSEKKEQTYLKKLEPPKWNGDLVEFAEFKRKWQSQVSKANLPADSELDRLRESIPLQASKALFGESSMDKAWAILESLYGDKDLIACKLKSQLKCIKAKGRTDYDMVIDLVTDVNNIILRLKAIKMEEALQVDSEFLSAIYRALPAHYQTKWLEFDKSLYKNKWCAFVKYLEIARDQAVQNKVLLSEYDVKEADIICRSCGGRGHKANKCTSTNSHRGGGHIGTVTVVKDSAADPVSKQEREKRDRASCGTCPLCKDRHTFYSVKEKEMWPSDRLFRCETFKNMGIKDRASTLERLKCCARCTSWSHQRDSCKVNTKCRNVVNNKVCGGTHSTFVCGSGSAYCGAVQSPKLVAVNSADLVSSEESLSSPQLPDLNAETLLLFQEVSVFSSASANVCWDNGSTRCLVTHKYAKDNNLRGQRIVFRLDVVGGKGDPQDGFFYDLELVQNNGVRKKIWAFGVDHIMDPPTPVDLSLLRSLFPHLPAEVFSPKTMRQVDLLIGNNFASLQPSGGQGRDAVGDLRAYQSSFGFGWVLAGTHPDIRISSQSLSCQATSLARVFRCEVIPELSVGFWEQDCLGVQPPKRCGKCSRCSECSDSSLVRSRRDQEELNVLKQGVKLINGQIHVSYPFRRDPSCLPNNRDAVIKMAAKQEKRLLKEGFLEYYNQEFQKYLERGAAVLLTEQELDDYKGPINYISHHGVVQDSTTTPLRIVTNSSLKNGRYSLNECLVRGPNSLNLMIEVALRFRCHEVGCVSDLTKAYNSLKTGLIERHLRRFVWRFNPQDSWKDFAFDRVAFGDVPAANLLEIARNLTADQGVSIDAVAARKIKEDSYVDDHVSGGTAEEVSRMKGIRLADGSYSGTLRQILEKGNLKLKVIVSSGEMEESVKNLINNKVLGYGWNASNDDMAVDFPMHLSNKKRKSRSSPALSSDDLDSLASTKFTKRICLGLCNSILDFMGIACPFTLRFKLLMRELHDGVNKDLTYDGEIPQQNVKQWIELIKEAVCTSSLCFPRCVRPKGAVGQPLLVGFADGAKPAFAGCVYLQWQISCSHGLTECNMDFDANLLFGKARVTPLSGYTIARSELSGLVLVSRMALTAVKALRTEKYMQPRGVVLLSDSECNISALDTTARALKPFFHNRVSEILENLDAMRKFCEVEDVYHVAGDLNPADVATRGLAKLSEIGPGSFWQKGPAFLRSGRDSWPVSRDFVRNELPDEEICKKAAFLYSLRACVLSSKVKDVKSDTLKPLLWSAVEEICLYSNSLPKVTRILAMVIRGWRLKSHKEVPTVEKIRDINASDMMAAERLILLSAMPDTYSAQLDGKLVSLNPQKDGAIIVTSGRIGEKCLSKLIGLPYLPILIARSRAAYLHMVYAHEGDGGMVHCSLAETLARSRQKVWIVKGRDLAKLVCSRCPLCRRRGKELEGQQMARIKEESLTVGRPFLNISIDFAGPLKVKGTVNVRSKKKCWIIVYCCRATKAVELLATSGYDTESFLLRHEEFVARRGAPASIVSDRGTQLVSASRIMVEKSDADHAAPGKWDWARITRENNASNWHFVPVGSPHFNGLPEATIKVLKKTLSLALSPGVELSFPELVTLLAKVTCTVNSRPLGLTRVSPTSQQEDNLVPLTPNMLLLGRSSNCSPSLDYTVEDRFCARLAYITQVENDWWTLWIKQVLPTLLSYRRWKVPKKDIEVGELVMLHYPGHFRDDYCLAKVIEVHRGEDNRVRKATVKYKKKNPREALDVCKNKPVIVEQVAVHRLHRLHLVDEDLVQVDCTTPT